MADNKTDTKTDTKTTTAKPAAAAPLAPAGQSSDPAVHALLAELQTAQLNDDSTAAQRVVDELADLGYTAT